MIPPNTPSIDVTVHDLQAHAYENSKRWFPSLHDQDEMFTLMYMGLGLAGEAGEVADDIKKLARTAVTSGRHYIAHVGDATWESQYELLQKIRTELSDVLAYLFNIAAMLQTDIVEEFMTKAAFNETRVWVGGNG